jgi:hypothetical protein
LNCSESDRDGHRDHLRHTENQLRLGKAAAGKEILFSSLNSSLEIFVDELFLRIEELSNSVIDDDFDENLTNYYSLLVECLSLKLQCSSGRLEQSQNGQLAKNYW